MQTKNNLTTLGDSDTAHTDASSAVQKFLHIHKEYLRAALIMPLQNCIRLIQETTDSSSLPATLNLFNDVIIVLNENFLRAHRHEMLFIDMLGSQRDAASKPCKKLLSSLRKFKTGSLLCLSLSSEFDNIILAVVTYTDNDIITQGYVSADIDFVKF